MGKNVASISTAKRYAPNTTREEATALIDAYKADNPESEAAYQAWKSASPNG